MEDLMPCDPFSQHALLPAGDLEPPERRALEAHLEACPACRALQVQGEASSRRLKAAGRAAESLPFPPASVAIPRRRPWAWALTAAAAGLALWVGFRTLEPSLREDGQGGTPLPVAAASPFSEGDPERILGLSGLLTERRGSSLRVQGMEVALQEGAVHLELAGEEEVRLHIGDILLRASRARFSAWREPASLASLSVWMREASADAAPSWGVAVWEGEVRLSGPQGGEEKLLRPGAPPPGAWRPSRRWTPLPEAEGPLAQETRDFPTPTPGEGYVLEMLLRKEAPQAELALRLRSDAGVHEILVGAYLPVGAWTRVRMACREGWAQARVGGQVLASGPASSLDRSGLRVEGKAPGLRVWGGRVDLKEVRWSRP
jgi:ferric-dicitrate binding protein FerR (iron transport regulator)